jgi:hypothetical protein
MALGNHGAHQMIRLLKSLATLLLAMAAGCAPRLASFGPVKPSETFRVGRATYSIPRAYLYPGGGAASTRLSVTLPGMSATLPGMSAAKLSSLRQGPRAARLQGTDFPLGAKPARDYLVVSQQPPPRWLRIGVGERCVWIYRLVAKERARPDCLCVLWVEGVYMLEALRMTWLASLVSSR